MLDALPGRVRYALGSAARLASSPWRQRKVSPTEVSTLFAASFGDHGWHHMRETLREYDSDPAIPLRSTTLWRFLKDFRPTSISSFVDTHGDEPLPLFVYPWGSFSTTRDDSRKDPWASRFCGPSTDAFIADEFDRTISLYREMRKFGYRPYAYPHSFIGGSWLISRTGERRFVVLQGNHRMAVLSHLRGTDIPVRTLRGHFATIRESEIARWPLVASGRCSAPHARAIFRLFFDQDGHHLIEAMTPTPVAPG